MINKQYRSDHQALKLGFIEAQINSIGYYGNKHMSAVFGNHEKDAARIVARYKTINPDALVKQSKTLVPTENYRSKILKPSTDPWEYVRLLKQLHGVPE